MADLRGPTNPLRAERLERAERRREERLARAGLTNEQYAEHMAHPAEVTRQLEIRQQVEQTVGYRTRIDQWEPLTESQQSV